MYIYVYSYYIYIKDFPSARKIEKSKKVRF